MAQQTCTSGSYHCQLTPRASTHRLNWEGQCYLIELHLKYGSVSQGLLGAMTLKGDDSTPSLLVSHSFYIPVSKIAFSVVGCRPGYSKPMWQDDDHTILLCSPPSNNWTLWDFANYLHCIRKTTSANVRLTVAVCQMLCRKKCPYLFTSTTNVSLSQYSSCDVNLNVTFKSHLRWDVTVKWKVRYDPPISAQ